MMEAALGSREPRNKSARQQCLTAHRWRLREPLFGRDLRRQGMMGSFADRNSVLPTFPLRVDIRRGDRAMEGLPVLGRHLLQILHDEILQELVGVNLFAYRLHLQKLDVASKGQWWLF